MISLDNQTNATIDIELLEKITLQYTNREIELIIIDSQKMKEINNKHRGKDTTTDVLSFPLEDFPHFPLGSILINSQLSRDISRELKHKEKEEIALLFIHGLLHLLGFDHEIDTGEMRKEEELNIAKFNLPKSLIVRTQE